METITLSELRLRCIDKATVCAKNNWKLLFAYLQQHLFFLWPSFICLQKYIFACSSKVKFVLTLYDLDIRP